MSGMSSGPFWIPSLVLGLIFAACTDHPDGPVGPQNATELSVHDLASDEPIVFGQPDLMFLDISEDAPGFAGIIVENGKKIILAKEGTDFEEAAAAAGLPDAPVKPVSYSFKTLASWYRDFIQSLGEYVIWTDIDERRNLLRAGVRNVQLAQEALEGQVPSEIFELVEATPTRPHKELNDRFRPVPGAVEITTFGTCTHSLNADHWNSGEVFFTASHCLGDIGPNNEVDVNQDSDRIGIEDYDPPWWTVSPRTGDPCPYDWCRHGDYVMVAYDQSSLSAGAELARTTGRDNGSLTVDGAHPRFYIVAEAKDVNLVDGITLSKVGRTTGWTTGDITQTCINDKISGNSEWEAIGIPSGSVAFICVFRAKYGSDGGDSGAPVFRLRADSVDVDITGIHYGGNDNSSLFSTIDNLRIEMNPDPNRSCSGLTTTTSDGCETRASTISGGGGDNDDCGPHAFQECEFNDGS